MELFMLYANSAENVPTNSEANVNTYENCISLGKKSLIICTVFVLCMAWFS